MTGWGQELRDLRDKEGLTRRQLAALASVAPTTIKAYELGHRNPSRNLLDALKADMHSRASILSAAGFAPDGVTPSKRLVDEYFTLEEAAEETANSPIPSCVTNEVMEVLAANSLMQRVWEVDLAREFRGPFERSMVSMISRARIADRILNWDEAVGLIVSIIKGHYGGEQALDAGQNPYFAAAVEHLLAGEPRYVQRFLTLWTSTQPKQRKLRFAYPITWQHTRLGTLRFYVLANPADQRGGIVFNDWLPLDGATWSALGQLALEQGGPIAFHA